VDITPEITLGAACNQLLHFGFACSPQKLQVFNNYVDIG